VRLRREGRDGRMRLIIAEKPSVARAIASVLGKPAARHGYLEAGGDLVSWAVGHLVGLAEPSAYRAEWARWSWTALPLLPEAFRLEPLEAGRNQLGVLASLVRRADVDQIVAATDADREGELIARWILRHLGARQPVVRLWLSEATPAAIRTALRAMRPADAYEALFHAAEARAQADWLVGLNATRAVTLRHGRFGDGALSVGRVQTPTLRLIRDRDREVEEFVPAPYWQVAAVFLAEAGAYRGLAVRVGGREPADRFARRADAERVLLAVPPGAPGTIRAVERRAVTVRPPLLYNLADLQKDANRRYGLTAGATLQAAQALYEKELTTYPRTEARRVSRAEAVSMPERLEGVRAIYPGLYDQLSRPLPLARITSDEEVGRAGHPAIVPTGHLPGASVHGVESRVFDLVARRTFAALMPAGRDERTTVLTEVGGETFRTRGTAIRQPGWRLATHRLPAAQDDAEDGEEAIPAGLSEGDSVAVESADVLDKETKAPPRLTDATLLAVMEKHGLGTPATRAGIVDTLVRRGYVDRVEKALVSTPKGRALLEVAPAALTSPELTGEWEGALEAIASGRGDAAQFLQAIREYAAEVVGTVRSQTARDIAADLGPCPVCHEGRVRATAKGWGCSRWQAGCPFTIWKVVAHKRITEAAVRAMLAGRTTALLKGFKSKAGTTFSARLQLRDGKVAFVFNQPAPRPRGRAASARGRKSRPVRSRTRSAAGGTNQAPDGEASGRT
jgi:DNA topoisomerase-3